MVVYTDGSKGKDSNAAGAGWVGYWGTCKTKIFSGHAKLPNHEVFDAEALSQPGFSRIVPRVLVSYISRLDTYPKCLPSNCMLNAPPGPVRYVVCVDGYIAPSRLRKIINK